MGCSKRRPVDDYNRIGIIRYQMIKQIINVKDWNFRGVTRNGKAWEVRLPMPLNTQDKKYLGSFSSFCADGS